MDHMLLNEFVLALSQTYDCTVKEDSMSVLSAIDRAFYIDDINYMSIADRVYTFWPLGRGNADLFCYVRCFNEKTIETLRIPSRYSIHVSTKYEDGVADMLEAMTPIGKQAREITINAAPNVDVRRIMSDIGMLFENESILSVCKRYVPTNETYHLPDMPNLILRPYTDVDFQTICQNYSEFTPCYHPNSVLKQYVQERNIDILDNTTSKIEGFESDFWTLFAGDRPVLSVVPNVYDIGMVGFMHHHILYQNNVSAEMIDFALKSLCCIYKNRGYVIRTIAVFDNDPFESAAALQRIGMVNDYQFVTIYKRKKR